jgi:hypothetical protein
VDQHRPDLPFLENNPFIAISEGITMTSDEAEILREELEAVFTSADFPVEDPMELVPVLPDGPATTFEAGDVTVGVMDLGAEYSDYQDYPYETAADLIDDLMTGFREEGLFE